MRTKLRFLPVLILLLFLIAGCSQQGEYIGSVNSEKYHRPSCEWAQKIGPGNCIWFSSKEEAQEAGYKPCKICKP